MKLLKLLDMTYYEGVYEIYVEDKNLNHKQVVSQYSRNWECEREHLFSLCKPYFNCKVERIIIVPNAIKIVVKDKF